MAHIKSFSIAVTALLLALQPTDVFATSFLMCETSALKKADCSDATSPLPAGSKLHFVASCKMCTAHGPGTTQCIDEEYVGPAELVMKDAKGTVASGTFVYVSKCGAMPLFRFDGVLTPGVSYTVHLEPNNSFAGPRQFVTFSITAPAGGDLGAPGGDSDAGVGTSEDGGGHDKIQAIPQAPLDEAGGCQLLPGGAPWPATTLALLGLLVLWRRRRSNSHRQ